ncbi:MAG TPA: VWA domain-containing protein [Terriglobales bacterium]|jgi:VWFA-related protein|nr:VWA domain-containing protein [Terriglobales bacterium]
MPFRFALATLLFLSFAAHAQTHIDLAPLGYTEPSTGERLTDEANASLDFVDANHVLLTFNPKKLLTRVPGCPPTHDDHMIHAVVLEVPSGKVKKEADWYLHDNRRYLWPLGSGKFLLRKLNSVYQIDSSLNEKLLLAVGKDISWLTVSADGKQIILETQDAVGPAQAKPKFALQFLSLDSLTPQQTIESGGLVHLNGNGSGYADALRKGDVWLVRFGPTPTQRKNIARVKSTCSPEVVYSSSNSLLIGRCPPNSTDYSVSAFTTAGRRLWAQHWTHKRFSPAVVRSDDNRRFAVTSFSVAEWDGKAPYSTENETDANHHLQQTIQIFDTASGNSIQSLTANPLVVSGQNFTLSPDSMQFAVLHNSQIDLYDLPKISEEEQAKFTALKADEPGLYIVSKGDSDESEVEAADIPPVPTPGSQAANTVSEEQKTEAAPAVVAADPTAELLTTFKASIQVASVDVVVTDPKGHPIKGLRQQDFVVAEDGKQQDVRSFHEARQNEDEASAPPVVPMETKPVPNIFSNDRQQRVSGAVTLILLDLLNTPTLDQQWARKGLIKFLNSKSKPRNSQFALCTLSSKTHLRMIQGFTHDENMLLAAVNSRKTNVQPSRWQTASKSTQNALDNLQELGRGDPMNGFEGLIHAMQTVQAEENVDDTDSRVGTTLDALSQLARYLTGIPGRKNLVWLSGSFPISIFAVAANGDMPADSRNYSDKIKIITNLLGQGHVAVYPVDVRGLDSDVTAVDNTSIIRLGGAPPRAAGTLETTGDLDPTQQRGLNQLADVAGNWATLNQIANDTGGKAFIGSNGIDDALATASEQGANYYSISYTPSNHDYNGKFRKIKVNLAQKGYRLHYRPGYFAADPNAPLKDASHSSRSAAMLHGAPESHEVRFVARVVPVGQKAKVDTAQAGKVYLASFKDKKPPATVEMQHHSLDFAIDSADLRFTPMPNDIRHCVLNFMISSFDDEGRQLSGVAVGWTSDLKPAEYKDVMTGGVRIHQEVDIPVASTSLRLGIEDDATSRLGTLELPLPVAAPLDMPRMAKHSLPEIEPD